MVTDELTAELEVEMQEIGRPSREITTLGAVELARRIRAGELTASEVVEAHIQHIQAVNAQLNAVVIPLFDQARAQAARADQAQERGEPLGPLHGVPVTIKEQYRVAGTETTIGLPGQVGRVYDTDGPLVSKLRQAGAIILGKTNVPQLLTAWETDSTVYGRANNPWNLKRSPGGSSGGEAAIIAAGGSPLGLGGDLGGSIRVPAHFCGIHGLKPTSGRLTNEGVPGHLFATGQEAILAQPGPMARTVADLGLAMEVLAAPAPRATIDLVPPVPWPDSRDIQVKRLRIGVYTDNSFFPASPALRRAVEEATDAMRARGAGVEPIAPPDAAEALRIFLGIASADGGKSMKDALDGTRPHALVEGLLRGSSLPRGIRRWIARLMAARGQEQLAFVVRSTGACSADDYWTLVDARTAFRARFLAEMDRGGFDAILCPPFALPAFTHGSSVDLLAAASYAIPYNVLGMPAGVVAATRVQAGEESDRVVGRDNADQTAREVERDSIGLPAGVQVVARHWREDVVLAVMAALETHFRADPTYPARAKIFSNTLSPRFDESNTAA
jgi:fatty acid amide hydrolase